MHITKVELENIKSHVDSTFEFSRGTTAITGPNGAGKTTIIEAIAWTLFDLLEYRKEDFVRRGSKKGIARVTFESGLDERNYTVYRDTGTGYYVYDPGIKTRIAEKKDEVRRFLWQHLGVEPGTDLESLFRRAIGVPQGTFTAIFLETAAERKKAFDRLLKVEEYRQGAEKLRETARYIENSIASVREKIARAEGELERFESLEADFEGCCSEESDLASRLTSAEADCRMHADAVAQFEEKEKLFNQARQRVDSVKAEKLRSEAVLKRLEASVSEARVSAEKLNDAQAGHHKHLEALGKIRELERERGEREKLRAQLTGIENAIVKVKADQKRAVERLENALNAHRAIEALKPKAAEQDELEKDIDRLRELEANAKEQQKRIATVEGSLNRLRADYSANVKQIKELQNGSDSAENFEDLRTRESELVRRLAALNAGLERDEKFQSEIKNGLCPILSEKCLNLKEGQTLESFITSKFSDLRTEISTLEAEQEQLTVKLTVSREAEKRAATVATLQSNADRIREEGEQLKTEVEALRSSAIDTTKLEEELAAAQVRLKELDNPRSKIRMFETEAARELEIRQELSNIESNLERLESDRRITIEQLEVYKDLDVVWSEQCKARDETLEQHRLYVANEQNAAALPKLEAELADAKKEFTELEQSLARAELELEAAVEGYDRDKHSEARSLLASAGKLVVEVTTRLENVRKRRDELSREIQRLKQVRESVREEYLQKDKLERSAEMTAFIRDTLKEAAPRVARNYVYRVSAEANQLFREISGDAEMSLKWNEDYAVCLEEAGHERPFANLSGGEQMAAALSVRLALLKQLTDIRIAFFDEPTTNMDAERRENLALQISNIKHFDQLFVISHDDTFEGYVDNVVSVGD